MRHGSLFSGIGGFDLAAEWMGWENVFHCEWNEFGQKVLHHYWPNAETFTDITKSDFTKYANKIDILTGGFPCQPYSMAGKRKGKEDERHLWPSMLRAIREIKPKYIVGENVFGLLNWNGGLVFDEVHSDLEFEGYEVQAVVIPAAAVNAPHGRDRVWFVATNTKHLRCEQCQQQGQSRCGQGLFKGVCDNGIVADSDCISNWGESKQSSAAHKQGWSGETNSGIGNEGEQQFIRDIASEGDVTNPECKGFQSGAKSRKIRSKKGAVERQGGESTNEFTTSANQWATSDTNGNGFNQRNGNDEINPGEGRFDAQCNTNTGNVNGYVADTTSTRRGEDNGERKSRFNDKKSSPNDWDNFPTQSPICGGDDGLPTELDGITFSKWRNESIKAYGNAIVPQVAYEIFKAIQRTI